jgi:outer membrane lipoprotein
MKIKHAGFILCVFSIVFVTGCTAGISQQSRSKVTYTGTFSALQKTPDVYKGEVIMLGGKIIETKASSSLSELIVLQLALDNSDLPVNPDQSEGRFIVQAKQLFDPSVYQKDMLLTVVGTLNGSKVESIGGFAYNYPLIELIEIKLWPQGMRTRPVIHFGIGVGTSF